MWTKTILRFEDLSCHVNRTLVGASSTTSKGVMVILDFVFSDIMI